MYWYYGVAISDSMLYEQLVYLGALAKIANSNY